MHALANKGGKTMVMPSPIKNDPAQFIKAIEEKANQCGATDVLCELKTLDPKLIDNEENQNFINRLIEYRKSILFWPGLEKMLTRKEAYSLYFDLKKKEEEALATNAPNNRLSHIADSVQLLLDKPNWLTRNEVREYILHLVQNPEEFHGMPLLRALEKKFPEPTK